MGMMTGTGLAAVISEAFVAFSTQDTLPFWSFVSSNIISLFVPSGGGHWAVQGPFTMLLHCPPLASRIMACSSSSTSP